MQGKLGMIELGPLSPITNCHFINMDTSISWFVCFCTSLSNLVVVGCLYTFSILFPKILKEFHEGKAKTAMVASVGMALYTLLCPVAVKLCERFGCRKVMVISGFTSALGLLGSSFAEKLYVLYFSFGVMVGFGCSLVYMAAYQIVPLYFDKHRDIATAMAAVGPGAGVLVMSPIVQTLLEHFHWRKTMLILAAIGILPSILGCSITRKKISSINDEVDFPRTRTNFDGRCCRILHMLDFSVFKDPTFVILTLSTSLTLLGHMIPYVHLAKYALETGVSGYLSSWMIFCIGTSSLVSRILFGIVLNIHRGRILYLRLFQVALMILAIDNLLVPMATNFNSLMVYSAVNGFGDGMYATSVNCLMMNLYGASSLGWFTSFQGVSFFASPVVAGFISESTGSYHPAFYTAGGIIFLACCLSQMSRYFKTNKPRREELTEVEEEELVVFQRETVL